ncbi:MAG TPA: hypothetical protein VN688_04655 [Gemmataceae bacterium]|nr:hypothetical protein [Gemmataceae bacterium]
MKFTALARVLMLPIFLAALLTTGCGKVKDAAAKTRRSNDLKQLGLLYMNYVDTNNKGPANADDLMKMTAGDPQAGQVVQAVKSGQYILLWGANPSAMQRAPGGSSGTILGYEKDVPTSGGQVLMGDGFVKNMTAAEFQSAPKAGGK